MTTLRIQTLDPRTGLPLVQPLPFDGSPRELWLRAVPGASAIHLPLLEDDRIVRRAEIHCDAGGVARVTVTVDGSKKILVTGPGPVFILPGEDRCAPSLPFRPAVRSRLLDVCFLVDGTLRRFEPYEANRPDDGSQASDREPSAESDPPNAATPLLGTEAWRAHAAQLGALLAKLEEHHADVRVAVLAFGDERPDAADAEDLRPSYLLYPERRDDRRLKVRRHASVTAELESLPPTSGGDFIDGLGHALSECERLGWRDRARRLLVLTGDSPGFSLLFEAPGGADARVRRFDVDVEAMRLHRSHVEIATIYHPPPPALLRMPSFPRAVSHVRAQYARLAARPDLAWEAGSFDPVAASEVLARPVQALGRGPTLGVWLRTE